MDKQRTRAGGSPTDARRWLENPEAFGLRFEGLASDLVRLRHTGWYVDEHCHETARGVVYRLPGGRGFLPGVACPWNSKKDGRGPARLYMRAECDHYSPDVALHDAALSADQEAECFAEDERQYQAVESARLELDELAEEAGDVRDDILELLRSRRTIEAAPMLMGAGRARGDARETTVRLVRYLLGERARIRNRRSQLAEIVAGAS